MIALDVGLNICAWAGKRPFMSTCPHRRLFPSQVLGIFIALCLITQPSAVFAQCAVPFQIGASDLSDARKLENNNEAIATCIERQNPSGDAHAVQLGTGGQYFGSSAPLDDGQTLIGSTSSMPTNTVVQAGQGIEIMGGPGRLTLSLASPSSLYSTTFSDTPTSQSTGLSNWLNQGPATVSNSAVGILINAPANGGSDSIRARYNAAPTPPYKITALVAVTRASPQYDSTGIGWYDGSSKLHFIGYALDGSGLPSISVAKYNSVSSYAGLDFNSSNVFSQPIWLQIADDGNNVSFAFSQDGANFINLFTSSKSSGWLGAAGYSNIMFYTNAVNGQNLATLLSWKQQ